jgi:hypothetical protein
MYFIIAFHPSGTLRKVWVRAAEQVVGLVKEGFHVYRSGTDQYAFLTEHEFLMWVDVHESNGDDK